MERKGGILMTFSENLIKLRKQNKMTQEEVAEKLNVTRQTISNWELNQTKPDLDQLIGLSNLYHISLDKLAGNNKAGLAIDQNHNVETSKKLVSKWKAFLLKNKNLCLMIFTLLCFIALGVCGLVDYALNSTLTWSYIPMLSILFGYIVLLPLAANKHKIALFLFTVTITILPYLYFLEKVVPIKGWFNSIAIPVTIIGLVGVWATYLICQQLKINNWYKAAILIFMWAGIISPMINHVTDKLPYISFQNFTNVFSSSVVAIICIICGYIKSSRRKDPV